MISAKGTLIYVRKKEHVQELLLQRPGRPRHRRRPRPAVCADHREEDAEKGFRRDQSGHRQSRRVPADRTQVRERLIPPQGGGRNRSPPIVIAMPAAPPPQCSRSSPPSSSTAPRG